MPRGPAEALAIESRRAYVAEFYLKGFKRQDKILECLAGVGIVIEQPTVSRDLKAIKQRWLESQIVNLNEAKQKELDRIDLLEREAWKAWDRSCRERQVSATERSTGHLDGDKTKARVTKEGRDGNPAFLERVAWCINKRCEILGLDAPKKVAPTSPDGQQPYRLTVSGMTDDELRVISQVAERHRHVVSGAGGSGEN